MQEKRLPTMRLEKAQLLLDMEFEFSMDELSDHCLFPRSIEVFRAKLVSDSDEHSPWGGTLASIKQAVAKSHGETDDKIAEVRSDIAVLQANVGEILRLLQGPQTPQKTGAGEMPVQTTEL